MKFKAAPNPIALFAVALGRGFRPAIFYRPVYRPVFRDHPLSPFWLVGWSGLSGWLACDLDAENGSWWQAGWLVGSCWLAGWLAGLGVGGVA